ncbi:hypothetical protein C8Q80DRAFT_245432 [Daedaleopsis nitida]|nr:hypothetical protein C8Q80DRAFT_245432 [Daedaleopsis nitida]
MTRVVYCSRRLCIQAVCLRHYTLTIQMYLFLRVSNESDTEPAVFEGISRPTFTSPDVADDVLTNIQFTYYHPVCIVYNADLRTIVSCMADNSGIGRSWKVHEGYATSLQVESTRGLTLMTAWCMHRVNMPKKSSKYLNPLLRHWVQSVSPSNSSRRIFGTRRWVISGGDPAIGVDGDHDRSGVRKPAVVEVLTGTTRPGRCLGMRRATSIPTQCSTSVSPRAPSRLTSAAMYTGSALDSEHLVSNIATPRARTPSIPYFLGASMTCTRSSTESSVGSIVG